MPAPSYKCFVLSQLSSKESIQRVFTPFTLHHDNTWSCGEDGGPTVCTMCTVHFLLVLVRYGPPKNVFRVVGAIDVCFLQIKTVPRKLCILRVKW